MSRVDQPESVPVRAFIQARMSSTRFPGKVLAPVAGRPLIARVIDRVAQALDLDRIVVATSTDPSDDPLAAYVRTLGVHVVRGPLDDVVARFRVALDAYPCAWLLRICGDSPLQDAAILRTILSHADRTDVDLVTNIYPRTFPKGQSAELINTATFRRLDVASLSRGEREHVTAAFYKAPSRFTIINVASPDAQLAHTSLAIDTVEDLRRLETLLDQAGVTV